MTSRFHPCGHRVWLASRWNGYGLRPIYIDDDESSETCGQEIDLCPTCGGALLHPSDLITEQLDDGLSRPQLLIMLRRLREDIERECGGLNEDQLLLMVDVCQCLGFDAEDSYYAIGVEFGAVISPLPLRSAQECHCGQPTTKLQPA